MKSSRPFPIGRIRWGSATLLGACAALSAFSAEETNAPPAAAAPPLTRQEMFEGGKDTYNNWIEFSTGGFLIEGSRSQFQQRHRTDKVFGGIEDFHYTTLIATNTTLTADGRALFDNHDYKLRLEVAREKLGYVRFSYNEFRTWYDGDGGFYPPTGNWYPLSDDALALDRGEISFEAGLTLEKVPKITFKYAHQSREGDKSSTAWGLTHPAIGVTRGLSPSFYDIDEDSDIFQLDATHRIKKTDLGLGLRYETGKLDDALKISQSPGEGPPNERRVTDRQGTTYDLFNVHAFTETWINTKLLLSSGYSFSDLDTDFSGSRIYGSDFDVSYAPALGNLEGYTNLIGGGRLQEYVMTLNLFAKLTEHLSITPSLRVQKEDSDASSGGFQTSGVNLATPPFSANRDRGLLEVRERLDLRYTGITNWVLYGRGEWTEGEGNLKEFGGFALSGPLAVNRETEDSRFFQKYSAGVRWYPTRRVTVDAGGYYKINQYDYDHRLDSTANNTGNRYPAYLVMQNFETYDGNLRLALRPWQNVTLVSRYEYQFSTIHTKPDPIAGLADVESSKMTSHIIAQNISWSPWSRLYLQLGGNYVWSETETPASDFTRAILDAQNNYWTLNFSTGFVLDDQTDLNLGYSYYRADNYKDNSSVGLPYGAGAEEHGITATLVRRLTKNLRLTVKYGYFHYDDATSGGNRNYQAHMLFSGLQYRF